MFSYQLLLQSHNTRHADMYLGSDGNRIPFEALPKNQYDAQQW